MHRSFIFCVFGGFLALSGFARGAETTLTPARALSYVRAGDLHFSPDGSQLAYVASSYLWDAKSHLRMIDIATGATREITPNGKSERAPQWSPDGASLAFLSNRGGTTQIYILRGGDAKPLTARKSGVGRFCWSPDGHSIAYLAEDDDAPDDDNGPLIADDERTLDRLWVLDPVSGKERKIGIPGMRIDELACQDTHHLLVVATPDFRKDQFTDAIYSVSVNDGTVRKISQPPQPFRGLLLSPDGHSFGVLSTTAHGPLERDPLIGNSGDGALHPLPGIPDLAVAELRWHEQPTLWLRLIHGFRNEIWRAAQGAPPQHIELPLSVASFDVSNTGAIAYVGEDFQHPPEIWLRGRDGSTRQISHLQEYMNGVELARTSIFKTKSFDGTEIEAALMEPLNSPPHGKLPLILRVHGGPSSNFSESYGWETAWSEMLASHGYQVLMVNPRGSNGYSEDFLKANRGDWGGGDYKDLLAVLDAVIARGHTDPQRLGIGGWSYGGEMSTWAITQSNRFKAAIVGAGVYDQQAEFETEGHSDGDEWYFGTPWEHPEVFARNSPSTFIANAHTPTLIVDGKDDDNNPVGQSEGLYRALKHLGVDTQMVLYPGEDHSPRKDSYNIDMFTRFLDWYDKYLKNAR
ncbi:MAG TPA: S9 family peptidase [Rhizomicrobium sp.]|jgi:dipeptidyl aminopeptidase/acylaminoacyl peptidase